MTSHWRNCSDRYRFRNLTACQRGAAVRSVMLAGDALDVGSVGRFPRQIVVAEEVSGASVRPHPGEFFAREITISTNAIRKARRSRAGSRRSRTRHSPATATATIAIPFLRSGPGGMDACQAAIEDQLREAATGRLKR